MPKQIMASYHEIDFDQDKNCYIDQSLVPRILKNIFQKTFYLMLNL